jgi:hypothetical protein
MTHSQAEILIIHGLQGKICQGKVWSWLRTMYLQDWEGRSPTLSLHSDKKHRAPYIDNIVRRIENTSVF